MSITPTTADTTTSNNDCTPTTTSVNDVKIPADKVSSSPNDIERINLRAVTQDGDIVAFKVRTTTPLGKLINAYCVRKGIVPNSVRFLYDGKRITPDSTPEFLRMEDDDIIDVMVEQTGGRFYL